MEYNGTDFAIKPLHHDPKRMAREFLRIRGVAYNDLITGDHAADLFAEFNKAIIDWNSQMEKLWAERMNLELPKPFIVDAKGSVLCSK